MADKRRVRRSIKRLSQIKTWQLLVLLLLMGFISATFLRLNNIGMVERREAVKIADETGDKEEITRRLYDLGRYVSSHMNTDLGKGVYLQHQYARDRQAKLDAAASVSHNNIYKEITDDCRARYSAWTSYFQCVTNRLNESTPAEDPFKDIQLPSANEYRFVFVSPLWSPDFAGFALLATAVIALTIVARLVTLGVLFIVLKSRYRSI